jgi:hypothetical protein
MTVADPLLWHASGTVHRDRPPPCKSVDSGQILSESHRHQHRAWWSSTQGVPQRHSRILIRRSGPQPGLLRLRIRGVQPDGQLRASDAATARADLGPCRCFTQWRRHFSDR